MSEWRGLHNPDWHNPRSNGRGAICRSFYCYACSEHDPCPCCLAAEVERLTADLADRDQKIADALDALATGVHPTLIAADLRGESDE